MKKSKKHKIENRVTFGDRPRSFKHLYLFAVKFQMESLIKLLK
jgi:hypothetical protein